MNTEEKIEAAGKKKEEGNALFKAGKYLKASKRYEKVNISEHGDYIRLHEACLIVTMANVKSF